MVPLKGGDYKEGKVGIVTGAGSGIGRETIIRFIEFYNIRAINHQ